MISEALLVFALETRPLTQRPCLRSRSYLGTTKRKVGWTKGAIWVFWKSGSICGGCVYAACSFLLLAHAALIVALCAAEICRPFSACFLRPLRLRPMQLFPPPSAEIPERRVQAVEIGLPLFSSRLLLTCRKA